MKHEYKFHYLADSDDANWKKYQSKEPVEVGQIIQLACDYYHMIIAIKQQKTGIRIDVSKSSESKDDCILLAQQYEYI